jgi:hypothetical protein
MLKSSALPEFFLVRAQFDHPILSRIYPHIKRAAAAATMPAISVLLLTNFAAAPVKPGDPVVAVALALPVGMIFPTVGVAAYVTCASPIPP